MNAVNIPGTQSPIKKKMLGFQLIGQTGDRVSIFQKIHRTPEAGGLEFLLISFLALAVVTTASVGLELLITRQKEALLAFGSEEDGYLYCDRYSFNSVCIPKRNDYSAPGRKNKSPLALCDFLEVAMEDPKHYGLFTCD